LSMVAPGAPSAAGPLATGALPPGATVATAGEGAAGAVPCCFAPHELNVNATNSPQHRRVMT
jgi:hypothetical protein